jgi:hypothetical protein
MSYMLRELDSRHDAETIAHLRACLSKVMHERDKALEDYEQAMHRVAQLEYEVEKLNGNK